MRVGVIAHVGFDGLPGLVRELIAQAPSLGIELSFESALLDLAGDGAVLMREPRTLDAVLAFGGDGTLLRAARMLDGAPAPIFGVNLGKLGFLTTCRAEDFAAVLPRFARGEYTAEPRMAIEAQAHLGATPVGPRLRALNDIVLHKGGFARVLRLDLTVGGEKLGVIAADGIVISTPTGSTAYSLSAGGPIVDPSHESIVVTPVAAHALAIRPFVLPPHAVVDVQPDAAPEEVLVTVDGQVGTKLGPNQRLVVRRAAQPVNIVHVDPVTFFGRLRAKMGWGGLAERDK
ncbi:MAG: NAD(+)/NADH kinase [Gemmatimonadaceae bacterium]|nr:NAD(+)/NADH kinase [Gemmatimonadaceae bacterium]